MTLEQRLKNLQVPAGHVDMVLDTDTFNEIDDQFAVSLAIRSPEKVTVKAFYAAPFLNSHSVSPEDGMERSYDEIIKLLGLLKADTPVFKGSRNYLPDEKTPVMSPAAENLVKLAEQYTPENPLYVLSIAAITNIASALLIKPEIADKIVVVWLGGNSLDWHDNREFNCYQDVAAARVVFNSGAPLVMLPCMGVVSAFATSEQELEYWLKGKTPIADYLQANTIREAHTYAKGKPWTRTIWDVTAVAWLLNDNDRFMLSRYESTPIPEYDDHWGKDARRPLCRYVYHINRDALYEELFTKLVKE